MILHKGNKTNLSLIRPRDRSFLSSLVVKQTVIAAVDDVVDRAGELDSKIACHGVGKGVGADLEELCPNPATMRGLTLSAWPCP
jgi:hypothetical protein